MDIISNAWTAKRASRRTVLRGAAVGGVGMAAAALVGCGSSGGGKPGDGGGAATNSAAGGAKPTVKRGGVLKIAHTDVRAWDKDLDPQGALGIGTPIMQIYANIYRSVVTWKVGQGGAEIEGELAEKWEQPEPGRWVFKLRPGVKFHNGATLTSEDVKFQWERNQDPKLVHPNSSWLDSIGSVETPDPNTVVYRQKYPFVGLLGVFASERPGGVPNKAFTLEKKNDLRDAFCGTGPYTVKERVIDQYVELKRFDGYWRQGADGKALPYLDGLIYQKMPEEAAQVAALRAGAVHYANLTTRSAELLKDSKSVTITSRPNASATMWSFHTKRAPTNDERVRRALHISLDRQDLINKVAPGGSLTMAVPWVALPDYGVKPDDMPAHYKKPDLAEAKKLLDAAGFANGVTVERGDEGTKASPESEAIREQWKKIGVDMKIIVYPPGSYIPDKAGFPHHLYLGPSGDYPDPDFYIYNWYFSKESAKYLRKPPLSDSTLDDKLTAARIETNAQTRQKLYREIQTYVDQTAPYLPLFNPQSNLVVTNNVSDYVPGKQERQDVPATVAWLNG